MHTPLRGVAGPTLALVLTAGALVGCGDDDTSTAPSSASQPSSAETGRATTSSGGGDVGHRRMDGEGYTIAVPKGWRDITAKYDDSAFKIDSALQAPAGSPAGAGTNINVIREAPEGLPRLQALAPQLAEQLSSVAQARPRPLPASEIDGVAAIGQTATGRTAQGRLTFVQHFTIHDDALYSITLTAEPASAATARRTLDGVLESWTWQ